MQSGLFISFEGIDGAGKSSHIEALAQAFKAAGRAVLQTREPGGTPLAEKLRNMVLHDPMDPLCEALLVFAARRDHLNHVIEPALARGDVVLCDRFTDATFALPTGGLRQPDITVWFALDPAIAAERLSAARLPDRFESQPLAFFQSVHNGYAARAASDPKRFAQLDASAGIEHVRQDLLAQLRQRQVLP